MAKKPSAAELKAQGDELAKQFAEVRKAKHFFSLQIGKEGLILKTHRRKLPEVLWRMGKKEGASNKGAKGVATMSGKVMELQCDDLDTVPSTLPKLAKAYFAERNQPARITLVQLEDEIEGEGEGDEGEEGAEENEEATAAGGEEAQEGGGGGGQQEDLQASLQAEYDELKPKIEACADSANKGFAKKIAGLNTMFETQISDNAKKARAVLGLLQTTIQAGIDAGDLQEDAGEGGAGEAAADPAKAAERQSRLADLEKGIDELLAQLAA